jgi:peptide/nickel transport system substrate-binding protein
MTEPQPTTGTRKRGGVASWACKTGFPPVFIFPLTPPERFGARNLYEFQMLMYRPLYWYGTDGQPSIDYDLSLAHPPEWSEDGLTVTVRLKPYEWSNGEPVNADNVMFWMHMLEVKKERYGGYVPGYFPDNLTSYRKVADDTVSFTFDRQYSHRWILMNQLSLITPMPRAWDRTADGPANATFDKADCAAVYEYLMEQNGDPVEESNHWRNTWPDSPVWSVVNGPWRLAEYSHDGLVRLVRNERYSGPHKPYLDEFRLVPTISDEEAYKQLVTGPDGVDAIQVGYLPFNYVTEPTDDPTVGGSNPFEERYRLVPQVLYQIHYFALNFNNPTVAGRIIGQTYFRQALQSTLDQDVAVVDIYKGYGYPTNGPIPTLPASDLVSPRQRNTPFPFDVDRARRLLTENGWDVSTTPAVCVNPGTGPGQAGEGIEAGTRLTFNLRYADGHPSLDEMMTRFQKAAAQAGIELKLFRIHPSVLVGEDTSPIPGKPSTWHMSCYNGGWVYGPNFYPTGEMLYRTGAGCNWGAYSDPKADELIDRTVVSDDIEDLYAFQDYIVEQNPVIWTPNFPLRLFEVAHELHGFEPINPLGFINPERWHYVEH